MIFHPASGIVKSVILCGKVIQRMIDEELEKKLEKIDINGPAPLEEPERQYYFIKKCRKYVKEKSEELGRPLTACSRTFGCQMHPEPVTA